MVRGMKYEGFLIVSDSISSFPRDSVPFEERVIKAAGRSSFIRSRKVKGKSASHCLEIIRISELMMRLGVVKVKEMVEKR